MHKITDIIFDWGGVLAPSDHLTGIPRLRKNFVFDTEEFAKAYWEHEDDHCDSDEYMPFLSKLSAQFDIPIESIMAATNADPPDEVFDIARSLSENVRVHVLSNQLKYRADFIQEEFDLSFFSELFFSNEIGLKKPDTECFSFVLDRIGAAPEDTVFIDDSPENIKAARSLGMHAILFENLSQLTRDLDELGLSVSD